MNYARHDDFLPRKDLIPKPLSQFTVFNADHPRFSSLNLRRGIEQESSDVSVDGDGEVRSSENVGRKIR